MPPRILGNNGEDSCYSVLSLSEAEEVFPSELKAVFPPESYFYDGEDWASKILVAKKIKVMENKKYFLSRVSSTEEYVEVYFCYIEIENLKKFYCDLKKLRKVFLDAHTLFS